MKRKTIFLITILGLGALLLSACQKSPDSSIVKNKDLESMIAQAEDQGSGAASVEGIAGEYDTYQTVLQDDALHVTVNVDAKVEIPKVSQMSIFRVKQKAIGQELLDGVREELAGGETLYDGSILKGRLRSDIEAEIRLTKEDMDLIRNNPTYDGKSMQRELGERQRVVNELQKQYESAPTNYEWEKFPFDGKLSSIDKKLENDVNGFYKWAKDLDVDDIYYGVSNGENGKYIGLYAQNNKDYGNCLRYSCDGRGHVRIASVVADGIYNSGMCKLEEIKEGVSLGDITHNHALTNVKCEDLVPYMEASSLTMEDARKKAEELLQKLNLTDFQFYTGGLYAEFFSGGGYQSVKADSDEKYGYRQVYVLRYLRNIDGVFVDNGTEGKFAESTEGNEYVKREWNGESIQILVNDAGIVGFNFNTPIELVETVVEKAGMKPFEEIKGIFEQMAAVTNAGASEEERALIRVDRVILRYTRISEPDSFDTGLLVPVWDFMGTKEDAFGEQKEACIMTINAIDGSIIDRRIGY